MASAGVYFKGLICSRLAML